VGGEKVSQVDVGDTLANVSLPDGSGPQAAPPREPPARYSSISCAVPLRARLEAGGERSPHDFSR
jgi:hypothetical protein